MKNLIIILIFITFTWSCSQPKIEKGKIKQTSKNKFKSKKQKGHIINIKLKNHIMGSELLANVPSKYNKDKYLALEKKYFDLMSIKPCNPTLKDLSILKDFCIKNKAFLMPVFDEDISARLEQIYEEGNRRRIAFNESERIIACIPNLQNSMILYTSDSTPFEETNRLITQLQNSVNNSVQYSYLDIFRSVDISEDTVSTVPIEDIVPLPSLLNTFGTQSSTLHQPYLDAINVQTLWNFASNYDQSKNDIGKDIGIHDIEFSWGLTHTGENIIFNWENQGEGFNIGNIEKFKHGINVMGIIKSEIHPFLDIIRKFFNFLTCKPIVSGLVPGSKVSLCSIIGTDSADVWSNSKQFSYALINSIARALNNRENANIILIEIEQLAENYGGVPIENDRFVKEIIKMATLCLDITVIEPAGNSINDLNTWTVFNLQNEDFEDSGALMVGALHHLDENEPDNKKLILLNDNNVSIGSNFGNRVNTFVYGQNILTTTLDNEYVYFHNTSAASAITAGIAASLQWYAKKKHDKIIPALVLRSMMTNNPNNVSLDPNFNYETYVFTTPTYPDLFQKIDNYFLNTP